MNACMHASMHACMHVCIHVVKDSVQDDWRVVAARFAVSGAGSCLIHWFRAVQPQNIRVGRLGRRVAGKGRSGMQKTRPASPTSAVITVEVQPGLYRLSGSRKL